MIQHQLVIYSWSSYIIAKELCVQYVCVNDWDRFGLCSVVINGRSVLTYHAMFMLSLTRLERRCLTLQTTRFHAKLCLSWYKDRTQVFKDASTAGFVLVLKICVYLKYRKQQVPVFWQVVCDGFKRLCIWNPCKG